MDSSTATFHQMDDSARASEIITSAGEPVLESELARTLGLSREDLKKLRTEKLQPGAHWLGGKPGQPILITASGQAVLTAALKKNGAGGGHEAVREAIASAQNGRHYVVLEVVRVLNARMLFCCEKKAAAWDGTRWAGAPRDLVRVLVRFSHHFTPRMTLEKCCPSSSTPGVYHYHGPYPRRKGRF